MTVTRDQIRKWREAHADLDISDEALGSVGPWPSLYVNDFLAYLSAKEADADLLSFIRDLGREVAWAYDNWTKQARDSNAARLLTDLLNNASAVGSEAREYAFVQRFIRDYAKANGIAIDEKMDGAAAPWLAAVEVVAAPPVVEEPS